MSGTDAGVALVTGGSRGIGAATARLLGRQGWSVAVNYRAGRREAEAVARAVEADGGRALPVEADTADPAAVRRMFEVVDRELGCLSALVNNAGIHGPRGRLDALTPEDVHRVLAVNVEGCLWCSQEAVARMSTRHGGRGGSIVNVSSGAANKGNPHDGILYALSKGALNSMTIGLAQEVAAEGIRVNGVLPGITLTDMPGPERAHAVGAAVPMGRAASPEEVAEAIVWLISEKASYIAGAQLRVAGGRL
jgi:NAD(P)-dependent dehydrogenase (short-subunit alcohol dehydrogenase family)